MRRKILLYLEFLVLFIGIPLLIYFDRDFIHPSIIILPVLGFVYLLLRYITDFRLKELIQWRIPRSILFRNAMILLLCLITIMIYTLLFEPENLFNLPRAKPWIFLAMCFFYPVFSAFGQEIIYRTFLFRRYNRLFPRDWSFIMASGITFSFLHIVYYNPVSLVLTFIAGLYLARVYLQTRSVLFSAVLHGILGIMVFGIGLGQYFWLDIPI